MSRMKNALLDVVDALLFGCAERLGGNDAAVVAACDHVLFEVEDPRVAVASLPAGGRAAAAFTEVLESMSETVTGLWGELDTHAEQVARSAA